MLLGTLLIVGSLFMYDALSVVHAEHPRTGVNQYHPSEPVIATRCEPCDDLGGGCLIPRRNGLTDASDAPTHSLVFGQDRYQAV